ncbi:unnamed protein product [Rotaria socialis]
MCCVYILSDNFIHYDLSKLCFSPYCNCWEHSCNATARATLTSTTTSQATTARVTLASTTTPQTTTARATLTSTTTSQATTARVTLASTTTPQATTARVTLASTTTPQTTTARATLTSTTTSQATTARATLASTTTPQTTTARATLASTTTPQTTTARATLASTTTSQTTTSPIAATSTTETRMTMTSTGDTRLPTNNTGYPGTSNVSNITHISAYTGPLIGAVEISGGVNSSYIYNVYSSPPTLVVVTNTTIGQAGLVIVNGVFDSFLLNGQHLPTGLPLVGNSTRRRRASNSAGSCTNIDNSAVRTPIPISCNDIDNGINIVCTVLGDPDLNLFNTEAFIVTACTFSVLAYPECVATLTSAFLIVRLACDVYTVYGWLSHSSPCDLLPTAPPTSIAQAPPIPPCSLVPPTCCQIYNNCPGETGHQCGIGCCCCPGLQRCCADNLGCCPTP